MSRVFSCVGHRGTNMNNIIDSARAFCLLMTLVSYLVVGVPKRIMTCMICHDDPDLAVYAGPNPYYIFGVHR